MVINLEQTTGQYLLNGANELLAGGYFGRGSMEPKIRAVIRFLQESDD